MAEIPLPWDEMLAIPPDQLNTRGRVPVRIFSTADEMFETLARFTADFIKHRNTANQPTRMILPVGRSGWAIAAGSLGLFSVLVLPAPLALICGFLAIGEMRRHPERHGMGRAIFGLIMGTLGSIGLVLFVIAAIARA